jgi:hypothetical protein
MTAIVVLRQRHGSSRLDDDLPSLLSFGALQPRLAAADGSAVKS